MAIISFGGYYGMPYTCPARRTHAKSVVQVMLHQLYAIPLPLEPNELKPIARLRSPA